MQSLIKKLHHYLKVEQKKVNIMWFKRDLRFTDHEPLFMAQQAVKNSQQHDLDGIFIKKWLPELAEIPPKLIHEPWKLNLIAQQFYKCELGRDYPEPIVDIEQTRKYASDIVWGFRNKQKNERS